MESIYKTLGKNMLASDRDKNAIMLQEDIVVGEDTNSQLQDLVDQLVQTIIRQIAEKDVAEGDAFNIKIRLEYIDKLKTRR